MLPSLMLEDQGDRLPGISLSLISDGDLQDDWRVVRFDAWERSIGLNSPYQVSVDLTCEDENANPFALDGTSCSLILKRGEVVVRRFHGIVHSTSLMGWRARGGAILARIEIVPAVACLAQGATFRRFQDRTVPEILEDLLTASLASYGREVSERLTDNADAGKPSNDRYLPRELCVQRNESDWGFARRLMEEEGISFFFEDAGDRERLVLVDANPSYPKLHDTLPVRVAPATGGALNFECIDDLVLGSRAVPASMLVKSFDATRPLVDLSASATSAPPDSAEWRGLPAPSGREDVYDFGAGVVSSGYRAGERTQADHRWKASLRLQEAQAGALVAHGAGNVTAFSLGGRFRVDSGRTLLDREYLLVAVTHHGEQESAGGNGRDGYSNTFEGIPASVPLRLPRQTRRERALFDVAVVVGPPGDDDIFVDEHGRIRINFVWNREDLEITEPDENRSCWVPVAQGWLGSGLGMQIIPRRGMRVLVGYTDGDPDQPIVLHCIETGTTRLPYDPSKGRQKTRTVLLRTQTSPPGNAPLHNELSTDDSPGKEELLVHAARDLRVRVDQDEDVVVARNENRSVDGTRTQKVHGDETLINEGNHRIRVDQNEERNIKGGQTIDVQGERQTTVGQKDTLTAKSDRETIVQGSDSLRVAQRREVTVGQALVIHQGNSVIECADGNVDVEVGGWLRMHRGGAQVVIDASGNITLSTDREIRLDAGGSTIGLANGKIELAAEGGIEMSVGASTLKLDATGVTTAGNTITESATVLHQTSAPIIAQN